MIDVETLSRLKAMRLSGMAEYFENLAATTGQNNTLTGPEMVKMAVDWEYERRRNSKLHRRAGTRRSRSPTPTSPTSRPCPAGAWTPS